MDNTLLTPGKLLKQGLFAWSAPENTATDATETLLAMQHAQDSSLDVSTFTALDHGIAATQSIFQSETGALAAIIGTPRWESEQLKAEARDYGHARALGTAYHLHGLHFTDHLSGEFALVIIDPRHKRTVAATDRLARHPIYYYAEANAQVVASSANTVLAHPGVEREIDEQGIYNYVYFHMIPAPGTVFRKVCKLQAAQLLVIEHGETHIQRYWLPDFQESSTHSLQEQSARLRQLLKDAVGACDTGDEHTGSFLSGGLDSSTVSGFLSSNSAAKAYSIGFSAEGYDEMPFARTSARHFDIPLQEYYVTPEDVVDNLPLIAASYDEPFGNSSALPAFFCAKRAAADGVTRLLAGDGGDELFAGNERYARQRYFERYNQLPAVLTQRLVEPLINALPQSISLARKAKSFLQQAHTPLPDRLQSYNFLHRHSPLEVFTQEFANHISETEPLSLLQQTFSAPNDASPLNRMLYTDWQFTLADNDLRKVSGMCALAGVDVRYPMLADDLIDFSCEIPSQWKLKGADLRHFYKQSLQGWLPDTTIKKRKQGFGLPFGVWMRDHKPLQELACDTLASLKKRPFFNQAFLDDAIHLHRSGHSSYYGELIWILTVFELWLSQLESD